MFGMTTTTRCGPNNSDRTHVGNSNANAVYRERVPHYTLPASDAIYQSWQVGRVLFIASDTRSLRDPNSTEQGPSKTMLGTAQKQWMEGLLAANAGGAEALVWAMPSMWMGTSSDSWDVFQHERDELVTMLGDLGWLRRTVMLNADMHALSISSGPGNQWGGFPLYMFASLDANYNTTNETTYDLGQTQGRQQYGTISVRDDGHTIALTGTGYINGTTWKSHTAYVHLGCPVLALDYTTDIVPPMEPIDDDTLITNTVTAKREDGGEYTHTVTTGPLSTQDPPDGVGVYHDTVTLPVADDEQLPSQAAWRARLGTVDEPRLPTISLDLARNPELIDAVAGADFGDRLTIDSPPAWLPPDSIDQSVEGYTETLGAHVWDWQANASPGSPWQVAQIPDTSTIIEDFEDTTYTVTLTDGGSLPWARDSGESYTGSYSLKSGAITHGQTSDVTLTLPTGASTLSFAYKVSSEQGFDFFYVLMGGSSVLEESGTVDWTVATIDVSGQSSVTFEYLKDASTSTGSDAAWIDDLTITILADTSTSEAIRLDTTSSELVSGVTAAGTELIVHTPPDGAHDRAPWIISDGPASSANLYASQFPLDLTLGGETVRATAIEPMHWDAFGRSETNTWGTSDSGEAWTEENGDASDRSVNGSTGIITLAANPSLIRRQYLGDDLTDCEALVSITPDQLATGDSFLPAILLRYDGTNYYRCRLVLQTSGVVNMQVAYNTTILATYTTQWTYSAGSTMWLRARIIGQRVLGRTWPDGDLEPGGWQVDHTVTADTIAAGKVGLSASAFSGNTNTSPAFAFDDFQVITPQRMTVTRSINTVSKSHSAGAAVALAATPILPL